MNITKPRILSGFMELSPADQLLFNSMLDKIKATYELYGFTPIDTPAIELSEILFAKGGGETEQEVYRFERGNKDMALRYDLTVPTARYVAQYESSLAFPFRRYAIGKVWRAERPQAGRFRELYQCDIDVIGSSSVVYDAEIPSIIYKAMKQLNLDSFTIRINNRKILNGFFEEIGVSKKTTQVMRIIDKVEKIGEEEARNQLNDIGMNKQNVDRLLNFINFKGKTDEMINMLKELNIKNNSFKTGVEELETVIKMIREFGVPDSNFTVDLSIARGLDYYTGTVYETVLDNHLEVGSICSGGRYDDLASNYTKTKLPGVGISIGLSRLFYKLREANLICSGPATPAKVLLCPVDEIGQKRSIELSNKLHNSGINTQVNLGTEKLDKQMRYADRLKVPYVVVIGKNEISVSKYQLKDMESGKEESLDVDNLIAYLSKKNI